MDKDIYSFVTSSETAYSTIPVPIVDNYEWHMAKHVKLTTLYLNSQFESGNVDMKPFFNIVLPAVLVQHRSVAFRLNEIKFFIDNENAYYKAFLVDKFHEKWARENDLSEFLSEMTETYTDYGGVLIKKTKNSAPRVIPFQGLAFVDQTDILSGVICEKHFYTPDELKEMEAVHWGDEAYGATSTIDDLIELAREDVSKGSTQVAGRKGNSNSSHIEVYELHGIMPDKWLYDEEDKEYSATGFCRQMQVIAYYKDKDSNKQGITLFKGREKKQIYKFFKRDAIYGRALGRGAVEELFDSQVWTNYSAIQMKDMLDIASKVIFETTDGKFANRNKTINMEQGEILTIADGKRIAQINTTPVNIKLFEESVASWTAHAKEIASSFNPFSATGAAKISAQLGQMLQKQASAIHEYRKQKIGGIFLPKVYKDWILPQIVKEIDNGKDFSSLLSMDEMESVGEAVCNSVVNEYVKNHILNGGMILDGEVDDMKNFAKQKFYKKGNQKFLKILAKELSDVPIDMIVNITQEEFIGAAVAEQLSTIFAQLVPVLSGNPQFFVQNPAMAKIFNDILESSGLDPSKYDLAAASAPQPAPAQNPSPTPALPAKVAPSPAPTP